MGRHLSPAVHAGRDEVFAPVYVVQQAKLLMAELDAIKKTRIAGLMLRRDWGKQDPWPTYPKEGETDLTHMSRKVKEVIPAAGLRDELSSASVNPPCRK
jgi:hypothetical protein